MLCIPGYAYLLYHLMLNILLLCSLTRECHDKLRDHALINEVIEFILVNKVLQVINVSASQSQHGDNSDEKGASRSHHPSVSTPKEEQRWT